MEEIRGAKAYGRVSIASGDHPSSWATGESCVLAAWGLVSPCAVWLVCCDLSASERGCSGLNVRLVAGASFSLLRRGASSLDALPRVGGGDDPRRRFVLEAPRWRLPLDGPILLNLIRSPVWHETSASSQLAHVPGSDPVVPSELVSGDAHHACGGDISHISDGEYGSVHWSPGQSRERTLIVEETNQACCWRRALVVLLTVSTFSRPDPAVLSMLGGRDPEGFLVMK